MAANPFFCGEDGYAGLPLSHELFGRSDDTVEDRESGMNTGISFRVRGEPHVLWSIMLLLFKRDFNGNAIDGERRYRLD